MMGVCQECLVEIDGRVAQACMVAVRADMKIRTMLP
jgi:predicted molibdopterin-dependent oxidoreductase YjgC